MKLSTNTIQVLKNFASINQNLVINEGNEIKTMSAMKNIVAKATVEETFNLNGFVHNRCAECRTNYVSPRQKESIYKSTFRWRVVFRFFS